MQDIGRSQIMSLAITDPTCSGLGVVRIAWNDAQVPLPPGHRLHLGFMDQQVRFCTTTDGLAGNEPPVQSDTTG